MAKQWSFGRGRVSTALLSGMGVPGGQETRPGGLVGAQGQNAGNVGGSPPDRVDQLYGFCTPFRPPVYSTPEVCGNAGTTLVGEVDMSLTQGGTDQAAGVPVVGNSMAAADLG